MFFKKRYHTLKIFNKNYTSLKKSVVFSSAEVEKIERIVVFLMKKSDSWELNFVFDKKDKEIKPEKVLSLFQKIGKYESIEKIPESIETTEEFLDYIEEKGDQ